MFFVVSYSLSNVQAAESTHGMDRNDLNDYNSPSKVHTFTRLESRKRYSTCSFQKRQRYEGSPAHTSVDMTNMSSTSSIPTSSMTEQRLYNTPRDPRQRHSHIQRERYMNTRQAHPSTSTSIQGSRYSSPEQQTTKDQEQVCILQDNIRLWIIDLVLNSPKTIPLLKMIVLCVRLLLLVTVTR